MSKQQSSHKNNSHEKKKAVAVKFQICTIDIEGYPFQLMLNMALLDTSLQEKFPWFWTVTLQSFENNEQGLPTDEEKEKLIKLMQDIIHEVIKDTEIQIVGTTTHKRIFDIMFYAKTEDMSKIGAIIAELPEFLEDKKDRFVNYSGKSDPNWELVKGYYSVYKV